MKLKLMLAAFAMLLSSAASADWTNYGKIEFQKGNKWVKASALCVAGDQFFHADAQPRIACQDNAEGDCRVSHVFDPVFYQPMNSSRARCDRREGEGSGGACLKWVEVDFIQTAMVKNVTYNRRKDFEEGAEPKSVSYTIIPACPADIVNAN
ncbi:MAG: hypothetical protein HRT45_15470 [Bdellovibrionales bacterium]|nr:hypothetical protein [Bdellovibrionales bacterium]